MSHLPVSRRQLLGGLALAATAAAGCTGIADDAAPSTALRLRLVPEEPTLREQYVVDLAETRLEWSAAAFEAALAGEASTTQYRRPFPSTPEEPRYARREGTYYRLGSVVVDEAEAVRPVLRLRRVEGATEDGQPTPVPAARLPTADERAVRIAWMAARARGNAGGVPWGLVQRGGYVYRDPAAVEGSELLGPDGPARLAFKGTTYAVEVARETFYEPVYRATVAAVAEDPERMEAVLRAKFVDARIPGDELSEAAVEVLEGARYDEYEETHPYSAGYREVIERLHHRAYLDGDIEKDAGVANDRSRLLRYDGEYFDYVLRFVTVQ